MLLTSIIKEYKVKIPGGVLIIVFLSLVLSSTLCAELNIEAPTLNIFNKMDNEVNPTIGKDNEALQISVVQKNNGMAEVITNKVNRGSIVDWTFAGGRKYDKWGGGHSVSGVAKAPQDRLL